ncbi:MAG: shikimate kinase [Schwartzia sp.]|nr:shikimate kinase [Schwartzia sp. (in: firmicutes)]
MARNVVLIGFMGTGKTSTGKCLASRLGFAFLDLDQYIEEREGCKIPEIFAGRGEAYFRAAEKKAVEEVAARKNTVIATGGGTVKDRENMERLRQSGVIVCLTADVDTIVARTSRRGERPVLDQSADRRQAVEELLESRRSFYAQADCFIDTSDRSPLEIAEEICHYLKREGNLHG